jgi:UDP-glucose 4-epimerase
MRIIVTGSEGFIGSKLCKKLEAEGHTILRIDRRLGKQIAQSGNFKNVDLIYHLAAQIDLQFSRKYPLVDAMDNIISTINLIELYPGIKIVYPATAASLPITSPYGLSKKTAAEYIKLLCKEYVICTLPNIWGPGGHGVINKFEESDVIKVNGDGHQTRTIVHVDDVVDAFVKAKGWSTGEYMLGSDKVYSVRDIAEKIAEKKGKKVEYNLNYNPVREGEVFASVIPNTTPDWKPQIDL